jgi:response regulator RpfG family c-di-GMP phosphodiesterase
MCVDDEPMVLNSIERLFEDDFDVLRANSGAEAVQLLKSHAVDVIVSDQRMPGMTGIQLFEQAKEIAPNSMRILLTGYADLAAVREAVNTGEVFRYLTKPWSNTILRETVRVGLEAAKVTARESHFLKSNSLANSSVDGAILVLDPNEVDGAMMRDYLSEHYRVRHATNLHQAMSMLEQDASIWLLLTEARIDGEEVTDFLSALKSVHPAMVTMTVTSIQDANVVIRLINSGQVLRYIGKPLERSRLLGAVKLAESRYAVLRHSPTLQARFRAETPEPVKQMVQKIRAQSNKPVVAVNSASAATSVPQPESTKLGVLQQLFSFFRAR